MENEKTYCNTRYDFFFNEQQYTGRMVYWIYGAAQCGRILTLLCSPFSGGWWWTWRGSGRSTSRGCSCCHCSCPSSWPSWVTWRPIRKVFRTGSGWCISPPVCPRMSPFLMPWPYVSRLFAPLIPPAYSLSSDTTARSLWHGLQRCLTTSSG